MINEIRKSARHHNHIIHCITNPISINQCANVVLSAGCRPIMAEHPEEVREITETAAALMLNSGNITDTRMESMAISAETAKENNIPIMIDVVGIACSRLRREFILRLLASTTPTVIKGNYSEIKALYFDTYYSSGVDADKTLDESDIRDVSVKLARRYNAVILASGKVDIITDGKRLVRIKNGTHQLSAVTGTGCMLGALCTAYLSVRNDIEAAIAACAVFCICGQLAETNLGNGSFMVNLMNLLSTVKDSDIENYLDMEDIKIEKF